MNETPDWSVKPDTPATGTTPPTPPPPAAAPPYPSPQQASPPPYAYPPPPGPYQGSYPPPPMPYGEYPAPPASPRNGLGVAALIVGVIALVSSFSVAGGIVLGIAAVVLGLLGRARVRRGEATNAGAALAGIIIGVVAIIAGLVFVGFWVGLFNEVGAGDYFDCLQQAGQDKTKVQQCSYEFRQSVENRFTVTGTPPP